MLSILIMGNNFS